LLDTLGWGAKKTYDLKEDDKNKEKRKGKKEGKKNK